MSTIVGTEFDDVDRSVDPLGHVGYLDAVAALSAAGAYKRQSFEVMQIQAGDAVLDVGCGAGDDLRSLAEHVGPTGRVVGIDSSETMVAEARTRTAGLPVECQIGDAKNLAFPDGIFAAVRADRMFQHLEDPHGALAELVRVTRPGGRVVVVDPDWDSLLVDASDKEVTRSMRSIICDKHRNGWMGRQLRGMFLEAGLLDVNVIPFTVIMTDLAQASALVLGGAAEGAVATGLVTQAQATAWQDDLDARAAAGRFFCALSAMLVSGRKA